jgi:hypothetical protein
MQSIETDELMRTPLKAFFEPSALQQCIHTCLLLGLSIKELLLIFYGL